MDARQADGRSVKDSGEVARFHRVISETIGAVTDEQWAHLHKLVPLWAKWEQAAPTQQKEDAFIPSQEVVVSEGGLLPQTCT